uniref:ATP-dependent Clp protease proteolytic subunit n=1 Tax=Monopsis flava TaxID=2041137 RepID=A0A291F1E8_9ASTR|nr:ATP-dependent protease proteolytic subunit [Monopsis flava]ATG25945.1 ATP-dependent protease proteolytic subunit [Monopsis flava]
MPIPIPTVPKIYYEDDDRDRLFNYHPDFHPEDAPDNKEKWIDLVEYLQDNRTLFLFQELKNEVTNQIIGLMLYLDFEEEATIRLYINSPGGSILNALALQNSIWSLSSPIQTLGIGRVASMAAVVLASGDKKRRVAFPSTRIMVHIPRPKKKPHKKKKQKEKPNPRDKYYAAEAVISNAIHQDKLTLRLATFFSHVSGRSVDRIFEELSQDVFMSAEEAKDFGLIDRIVEPKPETETETEN